MGSINPNTGMAVFIIMAAITSIVCSVIRTYIATRRKPPIGEDQATLSARLKAVERDVGRKQDATVCKTTHASWDKDIEEIRTRHRAHETKMSNQIGGVHNIVERGFNALSTKLGKLEGTVETYIKLKEKP